MSNNILMRRQSHPRSNMQGARGIRLLKRNTIYRGRVFRLIYEVLDYGGRRLVRETVQHPGAVVVVPMIDRSHLVFVRQYRRAVNRYLLELPAGTLGRGEHRAACARRELAEETGWKAHQLQYLGQFYTAPGFTSEQMTLFVATNLTPVMARPEPDEFIQPVILSRREAFAKIRSGEICDAKTLIGLFVILDRFRR